MTLKTTFLAAAAALTLQAVAAAQQPAPTSPPSGPATQPTSATPPAPATGTTAPPRPAPATPGAQAQATPPPAPAPVQPATAADLRAGVQVRDQQGGVVGTVESADAAGAVVFTGSTRGRLALSSFGRSGQVLVIAMTRSQLEAAIAAASPG